MFNFLKRFKFKFTAKNSIGLALLLNIVVLLVIALLVTGVKDTMLLIERQIRMFELDRREQIYDLYEALSTTMDVTITNAVGLLDLAKEVKDLKIILIKTSKDMKKLKRIDLPNIKNIKEANLIIRNITAGVSGSGTHIKIKGNSYILSVAHMIDKKTDKMYGIINDGTKYPLILEKIDKKNDLSLFKIKGINDLPYLELSKESPKAGSEIVIVGNPDSLEDIVTEGIIAKITKKGYIFTNLVFFGNSGGAILYKGKIIGVVSHLKTYLSFPVVYVNYGYGCNLKAIKHFLRYIKPY